MTSDVSLAASQSIDGCLDNVKPDLTRALSNFKEKLKETMFNILSQTEIDRSMPAEDFVNYRHEALFSIRFRGSYKQFVKYDVIYNKI